MFEYSFAELCLPTALSTGSARGLKKLALPLLAKVENMQTVLERNVLRADVMVAPLYFIADIIRDNHWGYLYNCACTAYPRLVREFYRYLKVVQDEDDGIILQTYVQGHMLQIGPQVISDLIDCSRTTHLC